MKKKTNLRQVHAQRRCHWLIKQIENLSPLNVNNTTLIAPENIYVNFSPTSYRDAIKKIIAYIYAGDIYQANFSQRFITQLPRELTALDLCQRLRRLNPAPFSAYLNFGEITIVSSSPERFLQLRKNRVEARPIKGTHSRGVTSEKDILLLHELQHSEKDRAENLMIVDLLRNDLSRVCRYHSVKVAEFCRVESYATVHHLVSVIQGELEPDKNAMDLLQATFPGGSITGAPKIRAMQIIAELEPTARGPYCGSICYLGFNGDMDSSILIRSFLIKDQKVSFQVGGAIIADSDPEKEYQETLDKGAALYQVLTGGRLQATGCSERCASFKFKAINK